MKELRLSDQRWCASMPGWPETFDPERTHVIGVLAGEGVGPEIVPAALDVLKVVARGSSRRFEIRSGGFIGRMAEKASGKYLTQEVEEFCEGVVRDQGAIFCGPAGGRFVYDLRARFDLYCKLTPLKPVPALRDAGVLRPGCVEGVDIVAVRENASGFYFGEWGREQRGSNADTAFHRVSYRAREVERILAIALQLARRRRGRLCLTVKPYGVPAISQLWEECMQRLNGDPAVAVEVLQIDNAAYQIIANPRRFDVIVSPNMFGDILADCAALLLGSRGMSYSGNFGDGGRAVYQTAHGAAEDIAGTDTANPLAQILSLTMMLRESFCWGEGAAAIETAVATVLARGYRTRDIAASGCHIVGTRELARLICKAIEEPDLALVV